MPSYKIYEYKDGNISVDDIVIDGPELKKVNSLIDLIDKYNAMANVKDFVIDIINKHFKNGKYDKELLDMLMSNNKTRRMFINRYLSMYKVSNKVLKHKNFVIDFPLKTDLPLSDKLLEKVPKGREYLVSASKHPNIVGLFLDRYFPDDNLEEYSDRVINKIMYTVAMSDKHYNTLKEFLDNNDILPIENNKKPNVVRDGYIEFPVYSIKGISKVSITLPPNVNWEGANRYKVIFNIRRASIENAIGDCVNEKISLLPILKLAHTMPYEERWYYISYAVYSINDINRLNKQYKEDLLNLLYDERLVPIPNMYNDVLQELKLKTRLDTLDKIFNNHRDSSKEVTYYLLYKLLHKIFPNNKTYWLNRINSNIPKNDFLTKTHNWDDPIRDLNIVDTQTAKGVLTFLICDYYDLNTDLSGINNLEEYYNFILDIFNSAQSWIDRDYIRKHITNNR